MFYAIFVSLLFNIFYFTDDSNKVESNSSKVELVNDIKQYLEAINKWLRKSGLTVNWEKTDEIFVYFSNMSVLRPEFN